MSEILSHDMGCGIISVWTVGFGREAASQLFSFQGGNIKDETNRKRRQDGLRKEVSTLTARENARVVRLVKVG